MSLYPFNTSLPAASPIYPPIGPFANPLPMNTIINPIASPATMGATPTLAPSTDNFTLQNTPQKSINPDPRKPNMTLTQFSELTPEKLTSQGNVRGLIFDADDTLSRFQFSPLSERTIPTALKIRLKTLQDKGFNLGVVSNNPNPESALKLQKELSDFGIQMAVVCNARKPDTQGLKMMQQHFNLESSQVMMMGDSPLTDIPAGKLAGFKTAQVDWFDHNKAHKAGMIGIDMVGKHIQQVKTAITSNPAAPPLFFPPLQPIQNRATTFPNTATAVPMDSLIAGIPTQVAAY